MGLNTRLKDFYLFKWQNLGFIWSKVCSIFWSFDQPLIWSPWGDFGCDSDTHPANGKPYILFLLCVQCRHPEGSSDRYELRCMNCTRKGRHHRIRSTSVLLEQQRQIPHQSIDGLKSVSTQYDRLQEYNHPAQAGEKIDPQREFGWCCSKTRWAGYLFIFLWPLSSSICRHHVLCFEMTLFKVKWLQQHHKYPHH